MQIYYVYILQSTKNRHYIGYTSNLSQRISQHNRKHKGYTNSLEEEWKILLYVECSDKKSALDLERKLKSFKNYEKAITYTRRFFGVEHSD